MSESAYEEIVNVHGEWTTIYAPVGAVLFSAEEDLSLGDRFVKLVWDNVLGSTVPMETDGSGYVMADRYYIYHVLQPEDPEQYPASLPGSKMIGHVTFVNPPALPMYIYKAGSEWIMKNPTYAAYPDPIYYPTPLNFSYIHPDVEEEDPGSGGGGGLG